MILAGVGVCASRATLVVCCARGVPAARVGGLGSSYTQTVPVPVIVFVGPLSAVAPAVTGAWAGLEWWRGAPAALVALAAVLAVVARTTRLLGGVTGDVFGASIEVTLAAILMALT